MTLFQPTSIVLPHHNLVQSTRQEFLKTIVAKRPITKKIILIGPDHFSANQRQILSSSRLWHLSTGDIQSVNPLHLPENNLVLQNDHAIYNPLADLKTYFPEASVFPILIGQKVGFDSLDPLITQLHSICQSDCLLVASVDFSHYLPATLAEVHDAYTLDKLQNRDFLSIQNAEVDSPQSLYVLTKFSQSQKFNIFAHTNSGFLANNPDIETTTHIFGSYSKGFSLKSDISTVTYTPTLIDRSLNQNTLGDRFFYGTNFFLDTSTLPDFVIGAYGDSKTTTKVFLPLKNNLFVRGPEKQALIKTYFDSLPADKSLTKDYFWGKLTYERN